MEDILVQVSYSKDGKHEVAQGRGETVLTLVVNDEGKDTKVQVIFAGSLSNNILNALVNSSSEVLAQLTVDALMRGGPVQ